MPTQDKRELIINAAIELIVREGLQATSMSSIAKKAGVAAGTIYTYFASKNKLVTSVFKKIALRITDDFDTETIPSTEEFLKNNWKKAIRYLLAPPRLHNPFGIPIHDPHH
ncbi:MAG: TetR/AcrR family transcriptional regulator [Alphaproteobacteria bacterium]|nr:TetR/AcrR family transcriptional regulator [Alphaproteobacteria bacterium]